MSPVQYRYRTDYEKVLKYTGQLHALMDSGEFWKLSVVERRKLVRRVNRLYRRLVGVFQLSRTRTILLAAGILSITGCPEAATPTGDDTADTNTAPVVEISEGNVLAANGASTTFTAVASDADLDPLTFTWFVDGTEQTETSDTFSITRSPAVETDYIIMVEVSDGTESVSDSVTLTIAAPGLAVAISGDSQVQNDVVDANSMVTFTAAVSNSEGGTVTYQWYYDGEILDGEDDSSVEILVDNSYPNLHQVKVDITEGDRTASRTIEITARIDPIFYNPVEFYAGIYSGSGYTGQYMINANYPLTGMVLGDVDGDGDLDALVIANTDTGDGAGPFNADYADVNWFRNTGSNGTPVFESQGTAPDGLSPYYLAIYEDSYPYYSYAVHKPLDFADIDNDGDVDLLVGTFFESQHQLGPSYDYSVEYSYSVGFSVFKNTAPGLNPVFTKSQDFGEFSLPYQSFNEPLPGGNPANWVPDALLVDVDSDGDLDLVFSYYTSYGEGSGGTIVAIAENTAGAGQTSIFTDPVDITGGGTGLYTNDHPYISAADFDLDGDVDIIVSDTYYSEGTFLFFENTGTPEDPVFETQDYSPFNLYVYAESPGYLGSFDIELIDLDDDGDLDILSSWQYYNVTYGNVPVLFENYSVGHEALIE